MEKYLLETYKIILSLVVLGIVGAAIEAKFSASAKAREKEVLAYEQSLNSFRSMSSDLAKVRATASRFVLHSDSEKNQDIYEDYNETYLDFVGNKVNFIHSMSRLNVGAQEDADAFEVLNRSSISLDECITSFYVGDMECDLNGLFNEYSDNSTSFEGSLFALLHGEK